MPRPHQPASSAPGRPRPRPSATACITVLAFLLASQAHAQYAEYPKKIGQHQPLEAHILPSWITLDMELRGRTELQTTYTDIPDNGKFFELTRARGGIELRPTPWLSGYLQFQDTHALGLPLRFVAANMRNAFDAHQAYLDLHTGPARLFVGRQELNIGDQRVVGVSDWANNARSWDGFDLRLGNRNRIDIFSTSVVTVHPTSLDTHGAGLSFHGAFASLTTLLPGINLEPFVLVHTAPRVLGQNGIRGGQVEVTPGLYVAGQLPAGFDLSLTGDLQRGTHANQSIHAGAAIVKVGYTLPVLPWTPRIQAEFNYATGDDHRSPSRISTYDQQYPSNHNAFGLVDLFGFQNIRQERANFSLLPRKNLSFLFQASSLHLSALADNVYASNGSILINAPLGGFGSGNIGTEFDASAKHVFHRYFVTNIGVGHLFPGAALTHSSHSSGDTLAYLSFTYRFTVNRHAPLPNAETDASATTSTNSGQH